MSRAQRARLQKRAWVFVAYTIGIAGLVAITPAYAMARRPEEYRNGSSNALPFILIGAGVVVLIGLFLLIRILLDLRGGTVSRYTGQWDEKLYKAKVGTSTRLRLAGHRRVFRLIVGVEVRQALCDGIDKYWQRNHGSVDIARRSRVVLEVRRELRSRQADPPTSKSAQSGEPVRGLRRES